MPGISNSNHQPDHRCRLVGVIVMEAMQARTQGDFRAAANVDVKLGAKIAVALGSCDITFEVHGPETRR